MARGILGCKGQDVSPDRAAARRWATGARPSPARPWPSAPGRPRIPRDVVLRFNYPHLRKYKYLQFVLRDAPPKRRLQIREDRSELLWTISEIVVTDAFVGVEFVYPVSRKVHGPSGDHWTSLGAPSGLDTLRGAPSGLLRSGNSDKEPCSEDVRDFRTSV